MAFPNLTIVIPHGGAARLRNLRAVLARLVEAEVEHALIMEMDRQPLVRELARAAGWRHVFVEQETTFHKTRVMNASIPLLRTPAFLWLDSDILITPAFLSEAIHEINTRELDCLVPWTTVRYLNASDSAEVADGRRDPTECRPSLTLSSRNNGCGGAILVRTDFAKRIGGMREEFHGWGREDGAFFAVARTLGRSAVTNRDDMHLHHLDHAVEGGRWSSAKHEAMVTEIRALREPEQLLRRYPRPSHFTPPWIGTKRIACAPGAEGVGRILAELYGPAVALCAIDEPHHAIAQCEPERSAHDAAIDLASSITMLPAPRRLSTDMNSLFVLSLPRSLSTLIYHVARRALGLAEPAWTTDGEVLNNDRYAMNAGGQNQLGRKFTRPAPEAGAARLTAFLDDVVHPTGFAYKDVVQPFVVAQWLTAQPRGLGVLRIRRNLAEVALSMLRMKWLYPAQSSSSAPGYDVEAAFLRGLLDAEAALDTVPAVEVAYDDLVRDESALTDALQRLAPGREIGTIRYIDDRFRATTEAQQARRRSERFHLIEERLDGIRRDAAASRA